MRLVKALVGGVIGGLLGAALIIGVEGFMLKEASWLALFVGVLTGLGVRIMGKTDRPGPCYLCGAIAAALTLIAFVGATMATTKILQARIASAEAALPNLPNAPAADTTTPATEEDGAPGADEPATETEDSATDPATTDEPAAPAEPEASPDPAAEEPATEEPAQDQPATDEPTADAEAAADAETPATEEPEVVEEVAEERLEVVAPAERRLALDQPRIRREDFSVLSFVFIGVGALIAYELGRSCGSGGLAV
jgi:hypothetical protein